MLKTPSPLSKLPLSHVQGIIFLMSLMLPGVVFAQTLYVKTDGTKVMAGESSRSEVVGRLDQGTAVELIEKSRRYYKVAAPGGLEGWIFKFKLTSKAPETSGEDGSGDLFGALGGEQSFAANESTTGSSIRGLSPTSAKFAKNQGLSPGVIESVKAMENYRVSQKDIDKFQREGRLGEYAN